MKTGNEIIDGNTYEVAIEILGEMKQPFVDAMYLEGKKENPSKALIDYCNSRIHALVDLQENMDPEDFLIFEKIFDRNNKLFRGQQ